LFQECKNKLSKKTFSLFSLIFLGNKTVEKKELQNYKEQFNLWGISHHLARSGLHLLLLIILFQAILSALTTSFLVQQIILFCVVILYTALSWISISYTRALITFVFYTCCNLLKLPIKLLPIIALVAIIALVLNPAQLFFLDFQLSFGLTFALGWLNHIKKK
jgi:competence protein ComEC